MQNNEYNQFITYKMTNPNSICGVPLLALNKADTMYISINDTFINFDNISQDHYNVKNLRRDIDTWLPNDYEMIEDTVEFKTSDLDKMLETEFDTKNYSLTAYFDSENNIENLMMSFINSGGKDFEMDIDSKNKTHAIFFENVCNLILELKGRQN